jgi:hypothetical protein
MRLALLCAAALIIVAPALALPFGPSSHAAPPSATATVATTPIEDDAEAPLVGTYDCQGVEPDGTPYHGLVQIVANHGTYDVIWIFSSGQQYAGLGVVNGDVLAVSYFTNRPGVVAYKIEHSDTTPKLSGQWTVVGAGRVFNETLTRVSREVKRPDPPPAPREPAPILRHLRPA